MSVGLLFWLSWIWTIVEICTVRIDAVGYPLSHGQFGTVVSNLIVVPHFNHENK